MATTYTSMQGSLRGFATDALRLYRVRKHDPAGGIASSMAYRAELRETHRRLLGTELTNRDVLVVGAGQTAREAIVLAADNSVTGIDLDVIPFGIAPMQYLRLLHTNGPTRAAKTIGRKMLGFDRRFRADIAAALGTEIPTHRQLQMDATAMTFASESFDTIASFSVFEHLDNPQAALAECVRVLRPGGLLSISAHFYSAEGGCHDLRIFAGDRTTIPYWAQLRAQHRDTVVESCYMNRLRLGEWKSLFQTTCPGAEITVDRHHEPYGSELRSQLDILRAEGELGDYSDEELLGVNVRMDWRKPAR